MAEAVISIRDGRDTDSAAVIHLVEEAYGEYEGCVLLVEEEEPALLAPATAFKKAGGAFWVVELDTHVIACIGVVATDRPELWELRKLYVLRAARKAGLGKILCHRVEDWVLGKGGEAVELFTGMEAGVPAADGKYPTGSVYARVAERLAAFDRALDERDL